MSDNLRDRIAAVICDMDALHAKQWSLDVADAVIEANDLRTRIASVLTAHRQDDIYGDRTEDCCCGDDRDGTKTWADHLALVLTDLLIDMAGQGELLKAIDRMYRDE